MDPALKIYPHTYRHTDGRILTEVGNSNQSFSRPATADEAWAFLPTERRQETAPDSQPVGTQPEPTEAAADVPAQPDDDDAPFFPSEPPSNFEEFPWPAPAGDEPTSDTPSEEPAKRGPGRPPKHR
jgi:hypothetical protein